MIAFRPWGVAFAQQVIPLAGAFTGPADIPPWTGVWIIVASIIGWVCSADGPLAKRAAGAELSARENIRRGLTSLSIGAITFVLSRRAGADDMTALIAAWLAGWAGEAAVNKMISTWMPRGPG